MKNSMKKVALIALAAACGAQVTFAADDKPCFVKRCWNGFTGSLDNHKGCWIAGLGAATIGMMLFDRHLYGKNNVVVAVKNAEKGLKAAKDMQTQAEKGKDATLKETAKKAVEKAETAQKTAVAKAKEVLGEVEYKKVFETKDEKGKLVEAKSGSYIGNLLGNLSLDKRTSPGSKFSGWLARGLMLLTGGYTGVYVVPSAYRWMTTSLEDSLRNLKAKYDAADKAEKDLKSDAAKDVKDAAKKKVEDLKKEYNDFLKSDKVKKAKDKDADKFKDFSPIA